MALKQLGATPSGTTDVTTKTYVDTAITTAVGGIAVPVTGMSSVPRVNDYLMMAQPGGQSASIAGGVWRGGPVVLPKGFSWDRVRFKLDTAGTAASTGRVVLYNDNATPGRPGTVLLDSSNFAADTNVVTTLTVSITPTTEVIWAGIAVNGTPASAPVFAFVQVAYRDFVWGSEDSGGPASYFSGTSVTWGFNLSGAAADNPTIGTVFQDKGQPRFAFRRSA